MARRSRKKPATLVGTVVALVIALAAWLIQRNTTDDPAAPAPPAGSSELLGQLTIAVEDTGAHYNREDWGDWASQGNSCDTREVVLERQGTGVQARADCKITSGTWRSTYDGTSVTDPSALDIDHVVPVKEANRSGTRDWTTQQRRTFYNDTDNLVAVSATSNRSKGDSDPGQWRPIRTEWCDYATRYVTIKVRYHLTVDQREHDALAQMLGTCGETS